MSLKRNISNKATKEMTKKLVEAVNRLYAQQESMDFFIDCMVKFLDQKGTVLQNELLDFVSAEYKKRNEPPTPPTQEPPPTPITEEPPKE